MAVYERLASWMSRHSLAFRCRPGISVTATANGPSCMRSSRRPPGRSSASSTGSALIVDDLDQECRADEQGDVVREGNRERPGVRGRAGSVQQAEEEDAAEGDTDGSSDLLNADEHA